MKPPKAVRQVLSKIYLNELDYFVKYVLRVKYYIRYVDDFVLLHSSKSQLNEWMETIGDFLKKKLKIELHPEKSRVISLAKGIDFVGFRNFYYYNLLRGKNYRKIMFKVRLFGEGKINFDKMIETPRFAFAQPPCFSSCASKLKSWT